MQTLTIPGGSARIVHWKEKTSGKVVASSRPTLAAVAAPKPAPSADSLLAIAELLAAEGMRAEDPALRSRLLNAAGRASIKSHDARERERAAHKPLSAAQVDAWVAEASARF